MAVVSQTGERSGERMVDTGQKFRESSSQDEFLGKLHGHFAVFNTWTKIHDVDGLFMESIAPGAFADTIEEDRDQMRVLLNHGRGQPGLLPLGPILELEEDGHGARYEVGLFRTEYVKELLPALKHGQFGASFRFQVTSETVNRNPGKSDYNPDGIEERIITAMRVREFGPVTFPAYPAATAGVRDRELLAQFLTDPKHKRLLEGARSADPEFDEECRRAEKLFGIEQAPDEQSGDGPPVSVDSGPLSPQLIGETNRRAKEQLRRAARAPALEAKYLERPVKQDRRAAQSKPTPPASEIKWRHGVRAANTIQSPRSDHRL
jgi:HK97 family phage prohead protease